MVACKPDVCRYYALWHPVVTFDHTVSQSAPHLTYHTPIAYIAYHSITLLLSHIAHG